MSSFIIDIASILWLGTASCYIGWKLYHIGGILDELEAVRVKERVLGYNRSTKEDS
jgi:hypothetical protein